MKNLLYILFLASFASCVDDLGTGQSSEPDKMVVNAEVTPGDHIEFFVSTSVDISTGGQPFRPVKGEAIFDLTDQDGEVDVEYDEEEKRWRTNRVYEPESGFEYNLSITLPGKDIKKAESFTKVPFAVDITNATLDVSTIAQGENQYEVTLELGAPVELPAYYRLAAFTDEELQNEVEITKVLTNANASENLNHHHGMIIDESKLDGNKITVSLSSSVNLEKLYFDFNTVNEDYYKYHVSLSRSSGSAGSPFTEPIVDYSNIQNGIGLFGAYSSSSYELLLK